MHWKTPSFQHFLGLVPSLWENAEKQRCGRLMEDHGKAHTASSYFSKGFRNSSEDLLRSYAECKIHLHAFGQRKVALGFSVKARFQDIDADWWWSTKEHTKSVTYSARLPTSHSASSALHFAPVPSPVPPCTGYSPRKPGLQIAFFSPLRWGCKDPLLLPFACGWTAGSTALELAVKYKKNRST